MTSPASLERAKPLLRYALARSREASTWRGIVMMLTGGWATAHPDQAETIVALGIALSGVIGAFLPDMAPGIATRRASDPAGDAHVE